MMNYDQCVSMGGHLLSKTIGGLCKMCGNPEDYEPCAECGFDHSYEGPDAHHWHMTNDANYQNDIPELPEKF